MHELSLAENIIEIVNEQLESGGVTQMVERVFVKAGSLNAIIPESLSFNFDVLKAGSEFLKYAVLDIETIPVRIRCNNCRRDGILEEPVFICLECGLPVEILSGQELRVDSIIVADE